MGRKRIIYLNGGINVILELSWLENLTNTYMRYTEHWLLISPFKEYIYIYIYIYLTACVFVYAWLMKNVWVTLFLTEIWEIIYLYTVKWSKAVVPNRFGTMTNFDIYKNRMLEVPVV